MAVSKTACHLQAVAQQGLAGARATRCQQEIHLAQFADGAVATRQRCHARTAQHLPLGVHHHEVGVARQCIGAAQEIHFRVVDGEARAIGTKFRHDAANDSSHASVVGRRDGAERENRGGGHGKHPKKQ